MSRECSGLFKELVDSPLIEFLNLIIFKFNYY